MSQINFTRKTFLEREELVRMQQFLRDDVAYNAIVGNTVQYGIIQTEFFENDINFQVSHGTTAGTIQIVKDVSQAVDADGNLIRLLARDNIQVTDDSNWYWVRISHVYRRYEEGTVSINVDGQVTGTGTAFTEVLRGRGTDVPTKVRFVNDDGSSANNNGVYEIESVTDDYNAILSGIGVFAADAAVRMIVVGSLPIGELVSTAQREGLYEYDSCAIDFIVETVANTPPALPLNGDGLYFYIARVKRDGATVLIQDRRDSEETYWKFNVPGITGSIIVRQVPAPSGPDQHLFIGTISQGVTNYAKLIWRGASGRPYYIDLEITNYYDGADDSPLIYAYFHHGAGANTTAVKPEFYIVQNDAEGTFDIYIKSPQSSWNYLSGYISFIGENIDGTGAGFLFRNSLFWDTTGGTPIVADAYVPRYAVWARDDIVDNFEEQVGDNSIIRELTEDTGWVDLTPNTTYVNTSSVAKARRYGKSVCVFVYWSLHNTASGSHAVFTLPSNIPPPATFASVSGIPLIMAIEDSALDVTGMFVNSDRTVTVDLDALATGNDYMGSMCYLID